MSIITPEVTDKICMILLPTLTIYGENFEDTYVVSKVKYSNEEYMYGNYPPGSIYKPDMITLEDETEIIHPFLKETKKFSEVLERVEHIQDCNDIKENGPGARCYNRPRRF